MTKATAVMGRFRAVGSELIRFDLAWRLVDDSATPLTVTVVNEQAGY